MPQEDIARFREKEERLAKNIIQHLKRDHPDLNAAYLPNMIPSDKVDFIFITMEPSFGRWAHDETEAKRRIMSGYKNFHWSIEDFIIQYTISEYLSESFYMTDISKVAMRVKDANKLRQDVYPKWIEHLKDEISLFGNEDAKLFFVGRVVEMWLSEIFNDKCHQCILHYSALAANKRKELCKESPAEFREFCRSKLPTRENFLEFILKRLQQIEIGEIIGIEIYNRIERDNNIFSDSRKELLFSYYKIFIAK